MWKTNTLINLNICFKYGLTKFFTFNFTADANMDRDGNYYKCALKPKLTIFYSCSSVIVIADTLTNTAINC